jgi:formate transporter
LGSVASALKMTPDAVLALFNYKTLIVANLVPVTLGNIVGGSLFVGLMYWYIYLKK